MKKNSLIIVVSLATMIIISTVSVLGANEMPQDDLSRHSILTVYKAGENELPEDDLSGGVSNVQKDNPLSLKVSKKTYKRAKLKKSKSFNIGATGAGTITYKLNAKAKKTKIKVNKNGKVIVPKKCRKGSYKITVNASGNNEYKAGNKTVIIKIK